MLRAEHADLDHTSSTNIPRDLHQLPVSHLFTYTLCLITWKALHTDHATSLSLWINCPLGLSSIDRRSSNTTLPARPFGITNDFSSSRAFSVSAPSTWNSCLPVNIRSTDKLSTLKRQLKSQLSSPRFPSSHSVPAPQIRFTIFGALQICVCMWRCYLLIPVPDMTYNVFSGTLNPAQSINHLLMRVADRRVTMSDPM